MDKPGQADAPLIYSYIALRRAVGVLGTALPFVVFFGAYLINQTELQGSISSYYYTVMRNVFVGVLWAIGVFLLFYKGYNIVDAAVTGLGGVFAIGISLFPTTPINPTRESILIGNIHFTFAALFFITLACTSIFLFTKTAADQTKKTVQKKQRNLVYRVCGGIMLACVLCIGLFNAFFNKEGALLPPYHPVFWLEAIAIIAFGVSWLIKGETILRDSVDPEDSSLT